MKQLELEQRLQALAKELEASKLVDACIDLASNYGRVIDRGNSGVTEKEYKILDMTINYYVLANKQDVLEVKSDAKILKGVLLNASAIESPEVCGSPQFLEVKSKERNFVVRKYVKEVEDNQWEKVIFGEYKRATREVAQADLDKIAENFPSILGPVFIGEEQ